MSLNSSFKHVFVYYNALNKYSFNALLGSLEETDIFNKIKIHLIYDKKQFKDIEKFKQENNIFLFSSFTFQYKNIKKIAKNLKKIFKNSIFIIGGPHATGAPKQVLKTFDIACMFECEKTIEELIKSFIENDFKNLEHLKKIKNLYIKSDDKYIFTGKETIDLNDFIPFFIKEKKFTPIEISRGCPYACKYCQTPQIFSTHMKHRNIDTVISLIKLANKYVDFKDIRFITPDAFAYMSNDGKTVNLSAIKDLLKYITRIKPDANIYLGTFPSEIRPEHVSKEALLILKKYTKNKNIIIGAQSGSNTILSFINRQHTREQVLRAVSIASELDYLVNIDFIFGFPFENEKTEQETIDFIKLLLKFKIRIHAHFFMPLPGTAFSHLKPKPIGKNLENFLNKLLAKGIVYGNLEQQKMFSKNK